MYYMVTLKDCAKIPGDKMSDTVFFCRMSSEKEAREIYALEMGCMPEDFFVRLATKEEVASHFGDNMELTEKMLQGNDEIDNAVYACLCTLSEQNLEWDMEIIGEVTEDIRAALEKRGIKMRWPGVVTNEDGTQYYEE